MYLTPSSWLFLTTGTLQMCGIFINAVTYVTIVIAIGLLVDFLMHILLRYYETTGATREEKVTETLETMGASMLMGGFTTWLGVIPLSLSSTKIFNTIVSLDGARVLGLCAGRQNSKLTCSVSLVTALQFVAFMAMVTWGLLVSLILMPVVLSYCGPLVCTIGPRETTRAQRLHSKREQRKTATVGHDNTKDGDRWSDDGSESSTDCGREVQGLSR